MRAIDGPNSKTRKAAPDAAGRSDDQRKAALRLAGDAFEAAVSVSRRAGLEAIIIRAGFGD